MYKSVDQVVIDHFTQSRGELFLVLRFLPVNYNNPLLVIDTIKQRSAGFMICDVRLSATDIITPKKSSYFKDISTQVLIQTDNLLTFQFFLVPITVVILRANFHASTRTS